MHSNLNALINILKNMTFILQDSVLLKISKTNPNHSSAIREFLENTVLKHVNSSWLIRRFSDIYVLIASKSSDDLSKEDEKNWVDILSSEQAELINKNHYFVLGFILINDTYSNNNVHFIDLIDSRVKGYNIAKLMLEKYEREYCKSECSLLPLEIIENSKYYWYKYFKHDMMLDNSKDLYDFISNNNIPEVIDWKYLYDCYRISDPLYNHIDEKIIDISNKIVRNENINMTEVALLHYNKISVDKNILKKFKKK